jgi:hypothetical protein
MSSSGVMRCGVGSSSGLNVSGEMVGSWKSCWLNVAKAVLSILDVFGSCFLNIPQNCLGLYFNILGKFSEYACLLVRHCLLKLLNASAVAG